MSRWVAAALLAVACAAPSSATPSAVTVAPTTSASLRSPATAAVSSTTTTLFPSPFPAVAPGEAAGLPLQPEAGALAELDPTPRFTVEVAAVSPELLLHSWRPGCPVGPDQLSLLTFNYWGFDQRVHQGEMVVHADWAEELGWVMQQLFAARFPLERVELVDAYGGDDEAVMAANVTSGFNCRRVMGGSGWSQHAYGLAVDINPRQNPYLRGGTVLPPEGVDYLDRSHVRPGMVVAGDAVVSAFDAIGWHWGGRWRSSKDWMHFSLTGR